MALVAPEGNGNLVEGNSHGSLPNIVATKPTESPAHVDPVSVNVADTSNKVKLGDCKHFSIRGYVSEVRKKDWQKCWPFTLEHDNAIPDENNTLPPLHVPNFRWWHCRNCLKDSEEDFVAAEGSLFTNSIKPKSGFCTHLSSHNLSLEQLMTSQQASSLKMIELGKVDAGSFVDKHRNSHYHSGNSTKPISEKTNFPDIVGSQNQRKKRTPIFNLSAPVFPHSMQQQTNKKVQKEAALRKIRNGSLDIPNHDLRHSDVCKEDISYDHPNTTLHNASETCETLKEKPNYGEPTDLLCRAHKESRTGSRVPSGLKDSRSNHPPLEMEENYDISETAEALQGTPGGSHRRRTRKVKLLTELLDKSADEQTHSSKKRDSSSRPLSERPEGEITALAPRVLAGVQGDPASSSVQHSGKRKFTPEEEWTSLNTSCSSKKAKTLNFERDGDDSDARLNSSCEEAFERAGSRTVIDNHLISFKTDRGPTLVKKKKKQANVVTRHVPLIAPHEEFVQPEACIRAADTITKNLFKSGDAAVAGKTVSEFSPSTKKPEKKSLSKKKGKILEHDGLMYPDLSDSSMAKERLMSRKDKDANQIKSFSGQHISTEDSSAGKRSVLSFNNWVPVQRYDKKLGTSMRDRPPLLSWRMNNDSQHYVGYSRFPSSSERGVNVLGGVPADPSYRRQNCAVPWPREKQMPPSLAEAGSHSLANRHDDCGPSNSFGPLEIPERLAFARRYSRQGVDPIAEPGVSDDILMEIVELMAKHQFERCLPDAENDKQFSGAKSDNGSSYRLDLNRAYGNEEALSPLQEEIVYNTKPTSNARTEYATGSHNMTSSKLKSFDFVPQPDRNLYDTRQVEHTFGHEVFRPFPQFVNRQQSEVQYTGRSSSRHADPESGQWIRKTVERKSQCSHSNMLSPKSSNAYPTAPHCKEGAQFWPPMISNNFPVPKPLSFDIVSMRSVEQPISEQSTSHYQSFNIKGTITEADHHHHHHHHHHLSFKSSKPEKHERKADSNAIRRTQANPKAACKHSNSEIFDLYPNDVVPAMHLLSLMDPRIRSEAHVNMDGNHEFLKKPPFLYDHPSKDLLPLPARGYEVINGTRHQSYDNYGSGKKRVHESISENSPVIPMFGASTSSQKNRSFKAANVKGDVLSKHQGKGKKCLDSGIQNVGPRKHKSASSNFGFDSVCGSIPAHTMPKLVLETKGSMSVPMQCHAGGNVNMQSGTGHAMSNTFLPPRDSVPEFCSINRNPSDFTEPGPGNPYMIRGEDLIPISAFYSDFGRFSTKLAAFKQQKKHSASKEHSRFQTH